MPSIAELVADRKKADELLKFVVYWYGEMGEHGKAIFRKEIFEWWKQAIPAQPSPPEKTGEARGGAKPTVDQVAEDAAEQIDSIRELADEVISSRSDKGAEFAESVLETALSIGATIETTGIVTVNQQRALDNIQDGLRNWIRD